jgi:predicted GNAT family acetyltransferase
MAAVRDNKAQNRFELDVDGAVAFANYRITPAAVIITHTETPRALRGRGIASELVKGALELIRADGRKVVAGCGFVVDYLRREPGICRSDGDAVRERGHPESPPQAVSTCHRPASRRSGSRPHVIRIDISGRPSSLHNSTSPFTTGRHFPACPNR